MADDKQNLQEMGLDTHLTGLSFPFLILYVDMLGSLLYLWRMYRYGIYRHNHIKSNGMGFLLPLLSMRWFSFTW